MRLKSLTSIPKPAAKRVVRDIRRTTRRFLHPRIASASRNI